MENGRNIGAGMGHHPSSLVNLTQSSLASHLPIPIVSAPFRTSLLPLESSEAIFDDTVLQEASSLLREAKTRTLIPLQSYQPSDEKDYTNLQKQLASRTPAGDAFSISPTDRQEAEVVLCNGEGQNSSQETPSQVQGPKNQADGPSVKVPPVKKRRRLSQPQQPVQEKSQKLAEELHAAIISFLRKHGHAGSDSEGDSGGGSEPEDAEPLNSGARDVRHLCDNLSRCQAYLHTVPTALVTELLGVLQEMIKEGQSSGLSRQDDEDTEAFKAVLQCLEACVASLSIMTAVNMPKQIFVEDVILCTMAAIKRHLLHNVLALHDVRLAQMHRANAGWDEEDDGTAKKDAKSTSRNSTERGLPNCFKALVKRLQKALKLLALLLSSEQVEDAYVMPLVRIAAEALTVSVMNMLQAAATDFIVAAFKHYHGHRDMILEEVCTTILPNLPSGKRTLRTYLIGEGKQCSIQPVSALLLRIIQESIELPAIDSNPSSWQNTFAPAIHWSDQFWASCFDRFPSAKATKSETDVDFKQIVEQIVADLLTAYSMPELPAACVILQRLLSIIGGAKGLSHPESHVKQISVDLLSLLGARFFQETKAHEAVSQLSMSDHEGVSERVKELLYYLTADKRTDKVLCTSAKQFLLCRSFTDVIIASKKAADESGQLASVLEQHWQLAADQGLLLSDQIKPEEAEALAGGENNDRLKPARLHILKWLQGCIEAKDAGPQVRAKAVKALNAFIQSDPSLLAKPQVAACLKSAVNDDSPSVRLESLNLLGAHINGSVELAETYFDIMAVSTRDLSVAVRKAGLKIMWDSCVTVHNFPRAAEAACLVLHRSVDNEEGIQDLVARFFHSLWLSPTHAPGKEGSHSFAARAKQLALLAVAAYDNDPSQQQSRHIGLPLEPSHPLVVVLSRALEREEKASNRLEAGQDLANALLEGIIAAQDAGDGPEKQPFPFLLALHALALCDPRLCIPEKKPARFVSRLAPYLKGSAAQTDQDGRRDAEQLICILSLLGGLLPLLKGVMASLPRGLEEDLLRLIKSHTYQSVIAAASHTMCFLNRMDASVGLSVTDFAARCLGKVQECSSQGFPADSCRFIRRYLFTLAALLRHGSTMIETKACSPEYQGPPISGDLCFKECTAICLDGRASALMSEQALRTMGALGTARPEVLLRTESRSILAAALGPSADYPMKRAALSILLDLLKAEEDRLAEEQKKEEAVQGKLRKQGKAKAKEKIIVPKENSERDALSTSSSILQDNKDFVLRLATQHTMLAGASPATSSKANADIRHSALQLIDAVERNGVLPPWTFVPQLIALTTDYSRENAKCATLVLKRIATKHPDMVQRHIGDGLEEAFKLQTRVIGGSPAAMSSAAAQRSVVRGMSSLYAEVLHSAKQGRLAVLAALTRRFEAACDPSSPSTSDTGLLCMCAHIAAELPLKQGDEAFCIVHPINQLISRRGEGVLAAVKAVVHAKNAGSAAAQPTRQRASRACTAVTILLLLSNCLVQKYSLTLERLAAFRPTAEKRKAEERTVLQAQPVELPIDQLKLSGSDSPKQLAEHYSGLKALLQTFHANHSYLLASAGGLSSTEQAQPGEPQTGPSPPGAETPVWAQQGAQLLRSNSGRSGSRKGRGGLAESQRRKSNLSRGSQPPKRKARKKRSLHWGSESEDDEDSGDEDYSTSKKVSKPRKNLEAALADD